MSRRVTEREYYNYKALLDSGVPATKLEKVVDVSDTTLRRIRRSVDYREFKRISAEDGSKNRKYAQQPLKIDQDTPKTKDIAEVAKIKAKELVDELKVWRSITKNRRNALALLKAEEALMWLNYTGSDVA